MLPVTQTHTVSRPAQLAGLLLSFALISVQPATTATPALESLDAHAGHSKHHHDHSHHRIAPGSSRSQADYRIPAVTLLDQYGHEVALARLLDSDAPVMLNFIFTACTAICPAMSATFSGVQQRLGEDASRIRMVSISIDPEQDTPAALSAYAQRFQAGPQWHFLTGSLDDIVRVQQAFDADRGDKMNHAPLTLLRATPDSPWVRYDGFATAAELAGECRRML